MLKNLVGTFLKKALYGFLGTILALVANLLLHLTQTYQPTGELEKLVWPILVGILTGLIAVFKRWATWSPLKAGK